MPNNIPKRYTSNGYSHLSLKERVNSLMKSEELNRTQARKKVAESIGYTSWKKIFQEPTNVERDYFFVNGFSDKSFYQRNFEAYLKNKNLKDTLVNYRNFLVHHSAVVESMSKKKPSISVNEIKIESTAKELMLRIHDLGPESILPQNLPEYLLSTMSDTLSKFLENPQSIEGIKNEDKFFFMNAIMRGVLELKSTAILLKDPSHSDDFKFSQEEIIDSLDMYSFQLALESISRKTHLKITKPTIENILDPNTDQTATFPEEAYKLLTEK